MFYWRAICVAATGQGQAGKVVRVLCQCQAAAGHRWADGEGSWVMLQMLPMLRCSDFKDTTTKHWLSAVKIGTKSFEF